MSGRFRHRPAAHRIPQILQGLFAQFQRQARHILQIAPELQRLKRVDNCSIAVCAGV